MIAGAISKQQLLNIFLRLLPLVAKLALTLYMGRYFSLGAMGVYGLVFGAVILLNVFLGQGLGYVVARDVVHVAPLTALHKMRDQALFFVINYLGLALAAFVLVQTGFAWVEPKIIYLTLVLAILESIASFTNGNMNSLNQQVMANATFFVRSGLWVIPVLVLGALDPAWRTVDVVLAAWIMGAAASIVITLWYWRNMPWREVARTPVDWPWLHQGLKKSGLIWLGVLGLNGGTYVDRFVVEHFLNLDDVGVVTYYFSFSAAMLTLMQSGVLSFAYPRLIAMHRDNDTVSFMREARQALWQVALGAGLMAMTLAIVVPLLGAYTQRPRLFTAPSHYG